MKKFVLLAFTFIMTTGYSYYNPAPQSFILFPADYMETHSPQEYDLPPQKDTPPHHMKVYNQKGEMTGVIVHGVYEPEAKNFSVNNSHDDPYAKWHMLPPE